MKNTWKSKLYRTLRSDCSLRLANWYCSMDQKPGPGHWQRLKRQVWTGHTQICCVYCWVSHGRKWSARLLCVVAYQGCQLSYETDYKNRLKMEGHCIRHLSYWQVNQAYWNLCIEKHRAQNSRADRDKAICTCYWGKLGQARVLTPVFYRVRRVPASSSNKSI